MRCIVFNLSGCPARWLGAYGNEWVATPHLDHLAAQSVVFDRHISDYPHPDAARFAWLNGKHQSSDNAPTFAPQLLNELRAVGVRTVLVRANHADTDGPPAFYTGWDEVFDTRPACSDRSPLEHLLGKFPVLLKRLQTEPRYLVWVETDRLIPPWNVSQDVFEAYLQDEDDPEDGSNEVRTHDDDEEDASDSEKSSEVDDFEEEEPGVHCDPEERIDPLSDPPTGDFDSTDPDAWEWLRTSFAAVVTTFDAELGRLLAHRELPKDCALLITSDFGYPLGEHGQIGLQYPWLHEELVHLPLMLRLPAAEQAGRRVPAFTQPADLMPTILDLFGLPVQEKDNQNGQSLLALARGQQKITRDAVYSTLELDGVREHAIRTDNWSLVLPSTPHANAPARTAQLYQKPEDYWEVNDLHSQHSETAKELETQLHHFYQQLENRD